MWKIVPQREALARDLPRPGTDDQFDAPIGYVLGTAPANGEGDDARRCTILGNAHDGRFLLPHLEDLVATWAQWRTPGQN